MANVFVEESNLQDIADAIREKNGTEDTYKPSQMADAVRGIQSGGEDNIFQYLASFSAKDTTFPEDYDLELYLPNFLSVVNFNNSNVRSVKLITDNAVNKKITERDIFNFCKKLIKIDFSEFVTTFSTAINLFYFCENLVEIIGELDFSVCTAFNGCFIGCYDLERVKIKENSIKASISFVQSNLLSNESIQSIIDGLADLTGGTAQTITFHKDIEAKLSDEQKAQITSKNWTLAFSK